MDHGQIAIRQSIAVKHVILALLLVFPAFAQPPQQANLPPKNEQKSCALIVFDNELRDAIRSNDVARIALLADYPLRINDEKGSFYIHDAASLQSRYKEIFTPAVQRAILQQPAGPDACGTYTFGYGNGEVWVNQYARGYAISSINILTGKARQKNLANRVEFVCRTDVNRIVVDTQTDGTLRLRAWNKETLLWQAPDTEIKDGKKTIEGTGVCVHSVWTFSSGTTEFELSGGGACYPDSNEPPPDALGQFVKRSGNRIEGQWCF